MGGSRRAFTNLYLWARGSHRRLLAEVRYIGLFIKPYNLVQPIVKRRIKICIVSHNGYGAISGGGKGFVGGVERQTSLLAKWLAERGHKVSFLTWDEGGLDEEVIDGVRVIKICKKDAGVPGLRFFYPKWSGLNAALAKANADVY